LNKLNLFTAEESGYADQSLLNPAPLEFGVQNGRKIAEMQIVIKTCGRYEEKRMIRKIKCCQFNNSSSRGLNKCSR
jgi:hypothetical protein